MDQSDDIEFDGWTLNRNSGELRKAGRSIRLRPQPLQVLEELLAHGGEVVSRAHLIARLWPKGIVDFDTALNSAVRRLRRALQDDADRPKYIETVPRKGYRFIDTIVAPRVPGVILAAEATVHPVTARTHVENTGGGLRAAMTAVFFSAVFGLGITCDSFEPQPPKTMAFSSPAPPSVSISETLRKARYFLERRSHGDLEIAREHFEHVLGLDPTRAGAYAGLASVYWLKTVEGAMPREVGLPKVKEFAERALSLDANEVEALQRFALYTRASGDRAKSDGYFRRALELSPDDALLLGIQASYAFADDRLEDSLRLARRAVAAAPLNLVARYNLAYTLYMTGRFDEALTVMRELLQFDPAFRADVMAYILILDGRHQAALDLAQSWVDGPDKSEALALAHFGLGNFQQADHALATLIAQVRNTEPLRVAEVYAYRRDLKAAFDWLRAGRVPPNAQAISPPGLLQTMKYSPFIAPLRADPRWQQWVASVPASG